MTTAKIVKTTVLVTIGIIVVGAVLLIAFGGGSGKEKKEIKRLSQELKTAKNALSTNGTRTAQASPNCNRPQGSATSPGDIATTPTTDVLLPAPNPVAEDKEEKLQALEVKAKELRKDIEVIESKLERWKENVATCRRVIRTDNDEAVQRQAQSDLKKCEKTVSKLSVLLKQKNKELNALYAPPTQTQHDQPATEQPTTKPTPPSSIIPTPQAPKTKPKSPTGPGLV